MHYARIKCGGKIVRRSLETDVFSTAKLKLLDFTRKQPQQRASVAVPTFADARKRYEQALDNDPGIKPQSRQYRRWCIRKLELSWPGLESLRLDEIKPETCREWAAKLRQVPEPDQFRELVANIAERSGGWGPRAAL